MLLSFSWNLDLSLICFVFFFLKHDFSDKYFSRLTFWSTNWQEADNKRLRRHDEQIWKERDRQAIHVQKRKPNKIVWPLFNIVVYINSKKKILTMATVYQTGICLHALHVNTFWAVKLHLITIGRIMHENGKLTMTFSFWWYLNVQGILFTSYTM